MRKSSDEKSSQESSFKLFGDLAVFQQTCFNVLSKWVTENRKSSQERLGILEKVSKQEQSIDSELTQLPASIQKLLKQPEKAKLVRKEMESVINFNKQNSQQQVDTERMSDSDVDIESYDSNSPSRR